MTNWLYRLVLRYVDVKRKSQKNKAIIDSCKQLNAYYLFSPFIQVPIDELPEHLRKCTPEQLDEINNNANVITMGAMVVGKELACAMADAWLKAEFAEGLDAQTADFLRDAEKFIAGLEQ